MMFADWTYDMFLEDAKAYKATPIKGVYPRRDATYREYFMVTLKGYVRDFKAKWLESHTGMYDRYDGWIGDAFAQELNDWFSDFYKDAYNQRPHLDAWYYVHALGLPMNSDTARMFCADPIGDACRRAKQNRG